MEESSLINLLKTFDLNTWHLARKFVQSPAHNQREDVMRLFEHLFSTRSLSSSKRLGAAVVFEKVFPGEPFDEKKLRYTRSFLYQVLLDMLAWQAFNQETGNRERYAAQALQARGLDKAFSKSLGDAAVLINRSPVRNIQYYYQQYSINASRYLFENSKNRRSIIHFQEFSDAFSVYFMAERLRQCCTALSHKIFSETDFKQDFLPEILALIEQRDFSHAPPVMLYYHSYKALTLPDGTGHFYLFRSLMAEYAHAFTTAEQRDIYLLAINYCIRQVNTGNHQFFNEILALYQEGLDLEVFIENGYLSQYTYNNIALAGIGLKKFDWTEQFIRQYKIRLDPRFQESAFHYNLAVLYFRKPEYDKALTLLRQAEFKDVLYNLDARRMLLRIYFDLGETEALFSLLDSFGIFLRRQKQLGYHREHYGNLLKFVRKLVQTPVNDTLTRAALRKEIENTTQVAEKKWLIEQV